MEIYDFRTGRNCIDQIRDECPKADPWRVLCDRFVTALEQLQHVAPEVRVPSGYFIRHPPQLFLVSGKGTTVDLSIDADDFGPDPLTKWHWRLGVKRPGAKLTLDLRPTSTEEAAREILRWLGIHESAE